MTQAANSNPDDFLLLFPPEVLEAPVTAESSLGDPSRREVQAAPRPLTPPREHDAHSIDIAPRASEPSGVRQVGMNVSPIGFIFGAAVGAFGMWLFYAPSPVQATAAERQSPVTTELMPAAAATDGTASHEAPLTPAVDTGPAASAVSEPIAVTDGSEAGQRSAVAPLRPEVNTRRQLPEIAAPSMPFKGSLALNSWPRGARAFVDGKAAGTTPLALRDLPIGSRVVRLEADGYQTWSAAVRVIANQQTQVTATLYRDPTRP
jgi:hypothetical protein